MEGCVVLCVPTYQLTIMREHSRISLIYLNFLECNCYFDTKICDSLGDIFPYTITIKERCVNKVKSRLANTHHALCIALGTEDTRVNKLALHHITTLAHSPCWTVQNAAAASELDWSNSDSDPRMGSYQGLCLESWRGTSSERLDFVVHCDWRCPLDCHCGSLADCPGTQTTMSLSGYVNCFIYL